MASPARRPFAALRLAALLHLRLAVEVLGDTADRLRSGVVEGVGEAGWILHFARLLPSVIRFRRAAMANRGRS
jgi:hypothetical protein